VKIKGEGASLDLAMMEALSFKVRLGGVEVWWWLLISRKSACKSRNGTTFFDSLEFFLQSVKDNCFLLGKSMK
jgi:hypothetical protein